MPDLDELVGRLYGLPLEDFTRERDAAARELRKEKERDAAAEVAKLPKPSQASWAANALAREQRDLVDALLAAGDELRAAQEGAVAGKGAGALREAAAGERAAVEALVEAAKELRPGGRKPTAQTLERLRTTLHAAATDDDVRAALDAGRLVEDAAGGAWGLMEGWDAPAVTPRPRRKAAPKKKAGDNDDKDDKAAERERKEREAAEEAERERRAQLEAELREARAERRSRERELDRAEKAAERAAKRLADALAAAEDAREQADEAKADLDTAREAAEEARDHAARLEEQLD